MFEYFKGTIEEGGVDYLTIDVQGVGYKIYASRLTLSQVKKEEAVKIFVDPILRQEVLSLFGFFTLQEREWFRLLLSVQGVGPKVALGILGSLGLIHLAEAIACQDKTQLTQADGVGPKLAGRILLELKDKLKLDGMPALAEVATSANPSIALIQNEAMSALIHLGYSRGEIQKAFEAIVTDGITDSRTLIRLALQSMKKVS